MAARPLLVALNRAINLEFLARHVELREINDSDHSVLIFENKHPITHRPFHRGPRWVDEVGGGALRVDRLEGAGSQREYKVGPATGSGDVLLAVD